MTTVEAKGSGDTAAKRRARAKSTDADAESSIETTATLQSMKIIETEVPIIGTTPLLVHSFPEKARKQMLAKNMKAIKMQEDARDIIEEIEDCRYRLPDGADGFPAIAFKAAIISACSSIQNFTKVAARQVIRVHGAPMERDGCIDFSAVRLQLVTLITGEPTMREDIVRLAGPGAKAQVRYRPEFWPWGVRLRLSYNAGFATISQISTMLSVAGFGVGIGDYRPERGGDCGCFRPAEPGELEQLEEHLAEAMQKKLRPGPMAPKLGAFKKAA